MNRTQITVKQGRRIGLSTECKYRRMRFTHLARMTSPSSLWRSRNSWVSNSSMDILNVARGQTSTTSVTVQIAWRSLIFLKKHMPKGNADIPLLYPKPKQSSFGHVTTSNSWALPCFVVLYVAGPICYKSLSSTESYQIKVMPSLAL